MNKGYNWLDGGIGVSPNWAPGSPKMREDLCVQFDLSDEAFSGKWSDVTCTKLNLVVCQKKQESGKDQTKNSIEEMKNSINLFNSAMEKIKIQLNNVTKNQVPIGFTYVQLPHEKEPGEIWSEMIWKDVSANYLGIFFRVVGGEAASFGKTQMENMTRFEKVNSIWDNEPAWGEVSKHVVPGVSNITIPLSGPSQWILTGSAGSPARYVNFELSSGEVRPKNMAIKVWRRVG